MAFRNYILITLALALIITLIFIGKYELIKIIWLKKIIKIIDITAIVIMILAVILFPGLRPVATTGQYAYKSETVQFTDQSRLETFLNDGSFRKLSVSVYYPDDGRIEMESCPLIVFSHGGISVDTSNESLCQELASNGYVVASIAHTYHALSTKIDGKTIWIDGGYMKELNNEDSNKDINNSYQCFRKWMELRTADINFVINTLTNKSTNADDASFYSLIDKEKIGVAGHSLGGSAALGVARQRNDIRAVIALESPFMCDITGYDNDNFTWNTEPYECAIMNIYSDNGYPLIKSDNKYTQNKNYFFNDEQVEYHYIEGSNHYSLTDLVRTSPILCAVLGGGYRTSGYDTLKFINDKCLEFFDRYLMLR